MTSVPAAASYREDILETLTDRFLSRLDQSLEEGREPEISEAAFTKLRDEFKTTFSNYLSTAFDVVFRNELSKPNSKPEEVLEDDSQHNLSVTNDDLQNLVKCSICFTYQVICGSFTSFQRFGQAKLGYGGLVLGSSQYLL